MKVIDLLNKIANGEEVPKRIKYKNKIYEWKEYDVCYGKIMTKKGWVKEYGYVAEENRTYFYLKHCYQDLNDIVEILEEPKGIPEKLEILNANEHSKEVYYENYSKEEIALDIETLQNWVNKIINYLDYLESKGE